MQNIFVVILIGLLGGAAVGVQSPIAGAMGQRIGGIAGALVVHISGAVIAAAVLAGPGRSTHSRLAHPSLVYAGMWCFRGVALSNYQHHSAALGFHLHGHLDYSGTVHGGILIDHFGWLGVIQHPVTFTRLAGVLVLLLGGS